MEFKLGETGRSEADGMVVNNPWTLGQMTDARIDYTANAVVEAAPASGDFTAAWTPIVKGVFEVAGSAGVTKYDAKLIKADGTATYVNFTDGKIAAASLTDVAKIAYKYDNVTIPHTNALPTLVGEMKGITLEAKARRIAVQYSQLAALQAKQDYGMDFESMIAEQAQAELSIEIDGEAVKMLANAADAAIAAEEFTPFTWVDNPLAA